MGKFQTVFAGDGNDIVDLGNSWTNTVAYGGSGNDTFNLPTVGTFLDVYGGDGDDVFDTDRDQVLTDVIGFATLEGDAGNDKMTMLEFP